MADVRIKDIAATAATISAGEYAAIDSAAGGTKKVLLGNAARLEVGTTAGTVAAGDHTHSGVYDPAGTASTAVSTHVGLADPHTQYALESALGTAAAANTGDFAAASHTHATSDITGLGTGVATALAVNTGSAGAPVVFNGALGTPSSGTLTSCTVKVEFGFACSDETTALTTGEKVAFYAPFAFTLTGVYACVTTAPTGSALTVDVEKPAGTSLLSAVASISASGFNASGTVSGGTQSISQGDRVSIDIDQIGSTIAGAGLKVFLTGTRT